jgi:lipopolysaccharide biosynthesis regulator YciM
LERDRYLAAAALAAATTNHDGAAKYFESVLSHSVEQLDPVALRLAFASYANAGDPEASLACVARSMQLFTDMGKQSSRLKSMLAQGHSEVQ